MFQQVLTDADFPYVSEAANTLLIYIHISFCDVQSSMYHCITACTIMSYALSVRCRCMSLIHCQKLYILKSCDNKDWKVFKKLINAQD